MPPNMSWRMFSQSMDHLEMYGWPEILLVLHLSSSRTPEMPRTPSEDWMEHAAVAHVLSWKCQLADVGAEVVGEGGPGGVRSEGANLNLLAQQNYLKNNFYNNYYSYYHHHHIHRHPSSGFLFYLLFFYLIFFINRPEVRTTLNSLNTPIENHHQPTNHHKVVAPSHYHVNQPPARPPVSRSPYARRRSSMSRSRSRSPVRRSRSYSRDRR